MRFFYKLRKESGMVLAFLLCAMNSGLSASGSSSVIVEVNTPVSDLTFSTEKDSFDLIGIKGCEFDTDTTHLGEPFLPVKVVHIIIPPNMNVDSVSIVSSSQYVLPDTYLICPTQYPVAHEDREFVSPDSTIYESDKIFPGISTYEICSGNLAGYKITTIVIRPLQYKPLSRQVILHTGLSVTTVLTQGENTSLPIMRRSTDTRDFYEKIIKDMVLNPEYIENCRPVIRSLEKSSKSGKLTIKEFPSIEGTAPEYIIITTGALETAFQELANKKTSEGIPAVVKTIGWITTNYPGCDTEEKIRNFLIDAKTKWDNRWVLLGGDVELVPTRLTGKYRFEEPITTDYYYSDLLSGNWNSDGDNVFGESSGDIDYQPDVFVGRLPAETEGEVYGLISKLSQYESPGFSHKDYQKKSTSLFW